MNYEKAQVERYTQEEPHFRRFEYWIGEACKGTVVIDPNTVLDKPVTPSTLQFYLREALISYRRKHWNSKVIPITYNVLQLKVFRTTDGRVVIENEKQDKLNEQKEVL